MADNHDPVESFKHATESTARVLAGCDDVEVVFGGHAAELSDKLIRLPALPKDLDANTAQFIRGLSDTMALKLHYHDHELHQRFMPVDPKARSVYEALEDARIEALGTAHYPGIASNIESVLRHDLKRQKFNTATKKEDAPLSEVIRLLARQSFTGREVPEEGQAITQIWNPWIKEHLGDAGMDVLRKAIHDQRAFAKLSHKIIEKMKMMSVPEETPPMDIGSDDEIDFAG